jgi:hypothetical protein
MSAKTAPRVRPLIVCWMRTSHHSMGDRGRAAGPALPDRGYSRIVSNWNLQPTGVSAFTTLKPDMVS